MAVRLTLQSSDRRERRGIMAALDASHCLIWFGPTGLILDANANTQSLLATELGRLTGAQYRDLVAMQGGSLAYYDEHWRRIASGDLKAEERDVLTADGRRLWCSLTHAPILTAERSVKLVFTLLIDLSPWNKQPKEGLRRIY